MSASGRHAGLVVILVTVAGISWLTREVHHQRVQLPDHSQWVTTDPDTHYHLRRLERLFREGFPVAGRDTFLSTPDGSAIPWPPFYTMIAWSVLAPFAPETAEARREWLETRMASLPLGFGVLTSVLAALAGRFLAGNAGALLAGGAHALCVGAIVSTKSGNGDHHAWIALLSAALLLGLSRALRADLLRRPGRSAALGAGLGAIAGVALGSWVASVLLVLPIQLALGVLVVVHCRAPRAGAPWLGLTFHLVALLVLLPAVLASPWREQSPWMVVNLSWFHPAWLLLGALIFVPLLILRSDARALRRYPVSVGIALGLLGILVGFGDCAPAAGIREGFQWMSRAGDFMSGVRESRAMAGTEIFLVLGFGVLLLPFAWAAAVFGVVRRDRLELLPWVMSAPLFLAPAMLQSRFADLLSFPMAVLLGWGAVTAISSNRVQRLLPRTLRHRRSVRWVTWLLAVVILLSVHWHSTVMTVRRASTGASWPGERETPSLLVVREMCDWLRLQPRGADDAGVLAYWMWGHTIAWAADRPTVACNFGTYVGEDAFRAPSRFFLEEDAFAGRELLDARRVRHVLLTADLTGHVPAMIQAVDPRVWSRYLEGNQAGGVRLRTNWFETLGARLMFDGRVFSYEDEPGSPLDFLRLVHVSARRDPGLGIRPEGIPSGWIWERVPGATIEAQGEPGDLLGATMRIRYPQADYELTWSADAVADADGVAMLTVPYATEAPNGDGELVEPARWSFSDRAGVLEIPERAVLEGGFVRVPQGGLSGAPPSPE